MCESANRLATETFVQEIMKEQAHEQEDEVMASTPGDKEESMDFVSSNSNSNGESEIKPSSPTVSKESPKQDEDQSSEKEDLIPPSSPEDEAPPKSPSLEQSNAKDKPSAEVDENEQEKISEKEGTEEETDTAEESEINTTQETDSAPEQGEAEKDTESQTCEATKEDNSTAKESAGSKECVPSAGDSSVENDGGDGMEATAEESLDDMSAKSAELDPEEPATGASTEKDKEVKEAPTIDGPSKAKTGVENSDEDTETKKHDEGVDDSKMDTSIKKPNYAVALQELSSIAKCNEKLFDDQSNKAETTGIKRSQQDEDSSEIASKKQKIDEKEEDVKAGGKEAKAAKKMKKLVKRMARKDIENLVANMVTELISGRSEIGHLRQKCDLYDATLERSQKKCQALQKQCQDLNQVMRKYITDVQNKPDGYVTPVKITRSVGLQVNTDRRRAHRVGPASATSASQQQATNHKLLSPPPQPAKPAGNRTVTQMQMPPRQQPQLPSSSASSSATSRTLPNGTTLTLNNRLQQQINSTTNAAQSMTRPPFLPSAPVAPPAKRKTSTVPVPTTPVPTHTTTVTTNAAAVAVAAGNRVVGGTSVIDVVDLSDDDEPAAGKPAQAPSNLNNGSFRVVPTSQLQPGNRLINVSNRGPPVTSPNRMVLAAGTGQPRPFVLSGNQLIPVSAPPSNMLIRPGTIAVPRQTVPSAASVVSSLPPVVRPSIVIRQPASLQTHPAPLPAMPNPQPNNSAWKLMPPKPTLKISKLKTGIVLSWNMEMRPTLHAEVSTYQIYAYQEGQQAPLVTLWKKVGDVKALPLPMACTLTQFQRGHKYHFAVRAQDAHTRVGPFSDPQTIALN